MSSIFTFHIFDPFDHLTCYPSQAVINSVEMYLNHQSLGQKIKINIVQMFVGDESLQSFGDIR